MRFRIDKTAVGEENHKRGLLLTAASKMEKKEKKTSKTLSKAMIFILLFGVVSLLSDMTHEGAASIQGSYLSIIGASAAAIGFVSGLGELIGYSFRLLFGWLADKTKKFWGLMIAGCLIDILAVPLLAFVGESGWIWACILLTVQRVGKAIKKPAKDTLLSFAASQEKVGRSFAIQEMLDQIGAFLGPIFLYVVMLFQVGESDYEKYSIGFLFLLLPAFATISLLLFTFRRFPHPDRFEPDSAKKEKFRLKPSFVFYIVGISFFAFGFIDYSLVGMHITNVFVDSGNGIITAETLPLVYSGAMIVDAVSALVFGKLFDRFGTLSLVLSSLVSAPFAALVFLSDSLPLLFVGIAMWGIAMGAQESILKAAVTTMVSKESRATGYGIFEFSFGIFWFIGSAAMGALYDVSIVAMVAVSIGAEAVSVPFYLVSYFSARKERRLAQGGPK